ncbi:ABC transporter permease [Labrys wisconsinensis]|uniref:Ribose transport system permease protein n=1 Tax=Labrys wisconsinensis TaxID=425677 RepID=A0ABU0J778_9HYPH|nr:ABC transporter permease [Labrys wisconsinensis]MDQ0469396.1 ribose transport system permease protein [Labrys wisconsinensis]
MSETTFRRGGASPMRQTPAAALSNLVAVYGLVFVFLLIMLVFGLLRPSSFFSAININTILVSQSVTAMLALAEMVPLATKQFDLSIGYHLGMAQVLIVGLQVSQGLGWPEAAALILLLSILIGLANGLLVTVFHIDSFIATMGTGTLLYGVTNWYSNGEQISGMGLPDSFTNLTQIVHGVPLPAVYVAVISVVLWIVTERLPVGRNLYVIGANVRAAELTGIKVRRHIIGAFVVSGLFSGFAGIVLGSILQTGTPSVGPEYLLPAFAATLLGATSIKPGRVNVIGTLLSVLVLAFSFSGVQQLGAPFYVQYFFNGGILIVAVGLSVYAARRRQRAAIAARSSKA